MTVNFNGKLVIAISSRALFDLDDSHVIYEQRGVDEYSNYQIEHENEVLKQGVAFPLVEKLLNLNKLAGEDIVEVILISRNSADTGLRVFNSIQHYQLQINRAAFTSGESPYQYIGAFGAHLFLSANPEDVCKALIANCAAATISSPRTQQQFSEQLRIAFDGDAVIFSDESERIFQQDGLKAFSESEKADAKKPLSGGPFKGFLAALHALQNSFDADVCPIRTALVTARSAPAHERVIRTLRAWNIRIDEAMFLGGLEKSEFLKAFGADIFFDDQQGHCQKAAKHVATGHVPHGVVNESNDNF